MNLTTAALLSAAIIAPAQSLPPGDGWQPPCAATPEGCGNPPADPQPPQPPGGTPSAADPSLPRHPRDFIIIGPYGGQRESDRDQWHTEGYYECFNRHDTWCPSAPIGVKQRGGFSKTYLLPESEAPWVTQAPNEPCLPYAGIKSPEGHWLEVSCIEGSARIMWESFGVLPNNEVYDLRHWRQKSGKRIVPGGLWIPQDWEDGKRYSNRLLEDRFNCVTYGEPPENTWILPQGTARPRNVLEILGPYEITTAEQRQATFSELQRQGVVPPVSIDEYFPSAWYAGIPQRVGRQGQSVHIIVRKDNLDTYCGSLKCADTVETYTYGVIGLDTANPFGMGYLRWNVMSLKAGKFYAQGTQDTMVKESNYGQFFATQFCGAGWPQLH